MNELNQTQWLSSDDLNALQMRRLHSLVEYAYAYVPHYKRIFDQVGFRPSDLEKDPASFQKIPPVTKSYIRDHMDEFITTEPGRRRGLLPDCTSGSTGEPFAFWIDRYCQDYAVATTFRHHTWCDWQPGEPRAYLWGATLVLPFKTKVRDKIRDFIWNRFSVNAFNLSDESMNHLAKLLRKHKPKLLHGYTSALYFFARFVRDKGWNDIKVPAVISSAEVLFPHQREYIEETFDCRVFNRYATHEVSGIACECEYHTDMHISSETVRLEILDQDDAPVEDGETGGVVVTSLTNYVMPFIRYRLADVGRMSTRQCPCGRGQPMLEAIEGRQNDMFRTRDGRTVLWGIDRPFKTMEGVQKFQLVQKSLDYVVVRVVKGEPMNQAQKAKVEETLRVALGNHIRIDFEFPDEISTERSGKYRYTVCEID
ncbi:MAG: phenylacetate--CoA ligase family protein [Anaerolineae bacterium]|nr:phenylacetate--CoA ligase family protein [Anaerolineae bacterium]